MQYAISIVRFDEEDNSTEIVDRYITADQAIDALLYVQSLENQPEVVEEVEEEEPSEVEEVEIVEEKPNPLVKKPSGRTTSYDKSELEADVREALLSVKEIANKYGVTTATVYQVRSKLKHADPTTVVEDEPELTAYAAKRVGRSEEVTADVNIEGEIKLAAMQGFSVNEIADMYPMVPLEQIAKWKAEAKH